MVLIGGGSHARHGGPPLLERDREVAVLRTALDEACAGSGRTVLVLGPAGLGKSRLLAVAQDLARERGASVLAARAARLEGDFPFGVVEQLLEPALAATDPDHRRWLLEGAGAGAASLFPRWATAPGRAPFVDADVAQDVAHPLLRSLMAIVADLAALEPRVLVIDDVQWADASSLRFLHFAVRRLEPLPVLLVIGARPGAEWTSPAIHDELLGEAEATVLRPKALSPESTAALLEATLVRPVDAVFARAAHESTGGNPLYLRELSSEIDDRGIEPSAEHAQQLPAIGPESIGRSVRGRLAHAGDAATRMARVIAVLGDGASIDLVAELAELTPAAATDAGDQLQAIGLLAPGGAPAFAHPILRAAVADGLAAGERSALHARAAALLHERGAPPDVIAAHVSSATPGSWSGAVDALRAAARGALDRGAPGVAAVALRRALAEPLTADLRPQVLLELGTAEALQREPQAAAHLAEARATAATPDERTLAALALWSSASFDGRISEGLEMLRETLAREVDATPELRMRLELELARATRSCRPTGAEGRRRIAALADRAAGADTPLDRLALGLVAYDALLANRPVGEVVGLVERALPLRDAVLARSGSQLLHPPYYTMVWCGEIDAAVRMLDALIEDARRRGAVIEVLMGSVWRALAHLRAGSLGEAHEDARTALAGSTEHGWSFGQCAGRLWLGEIAIERGELDVAGAHAAANARVVAGDLAQKGWVHHARHQQAMYLLERGDAAQALDELLAVGRLHDDWGARCPSELPWRSDAARAASRAGDDALARRLAGEELELARAFGAPRPLGVALRVAGAVQRGAQGTALLEEAVAVLDGSPARLEHARALATLGALLRARGHVKAAREPLRLALDGALRCDATALAERARRELIVTGARPRRTASSGPDALTAAERRVVDLAAQGAGNADLAQALFLSRKTVETHLSSAYRKLGITSRSELARALAAPGGSGA
jgi:DNA-binding CsgD family transcriptional regulator